jgi:hypothetical protein
MPALHYTPYEDLSDRPNIIVDGSPTGGTVLSLSHWPHLPVPTGLEADLSAEMALLYLDRFDLHGSARLVSNNHFDQDGLMSVYALVSPEQARPRAEQVTDVAAAGDFGTYRSRTAARISMTIAAFADPERSPLASSSEISTAALYEELLGRLPELLDHPERFRDLWSDEDSALTASEKLIESGVVQIEEVDELDLAIVTIPPDAPTEGGHRFTHRWVEGLHPMAIHNATDRLSLLTIRGASYAFTYRYESWVQYRSRRPRPRVDLQPLAARLSEQETGPGSWSFDGAADLVPSLHLDGADASELAPGAFRAALESELHSAMPAWDPYRVKVDL